MSKQNTENVSSEWNNRIMNNSNNKVVATKDNYLDLLSNMSPFVALAHACNIASHLRDINYYVDGDDLYWMEKPHKFPEFWVAAINGTLEDSDFEEEEE